MFGHAESAQGAHAAESEESKEWMGKPRDVFEGAERNGDELVHDAVRDTLRIVHVPEHQRDERKHNKGLSIGHPSAPQLFRPDCAMTRSIDQVSQSCRRTTPSFQQDAPTPSTRGKPHQQVPNSSSTLKIKVPNRPMRTNMKAQSI
jgi:hypothetical protein